MFCSNCGKEMNESAEFCTNCGYKNSKKGNLKKNKLVSIICIVGIVSIIIIVLKNIVFNSRSISQYENIESNNYVENNISQIRSLKEQIDNATILQDLEYTVDYDNLKTVLYGNYNNKPIEWIVLRKRKNTVKLISKYVIDNKSMEPATDDGAESQVNRDSTTSYLFKWLNSDFYYNSFNEEERNNISDFGLKSELDGEYHFDYHVDFLYVDEALNKSFKIQPKLMVAYDINTNQSVEWWLGDTGIVNTLFQSFENYRNFAYVDKSGVIQPSGKFQEEIIGVRPVISIEIKNIK